MPIQDSTYTPLRLEDYDISPVHGFLPAEQPLRRLSSPYYEPWEAIMDRFNQYLLASKIRPLVRKMPVLSIDKLTSKAEFQRAFMVLGFMAHAFVWGRNGSASESAAEFLPASISVPWVAIADYLQMNPVICCAAVCHWNWQLLDEDAEDPMDINNLGTLYTFSGSTDESWFYLVTTAMEAKGARGLTCILDGISAVETGDADALTEALDGVCSSLREMTKLLVQMYDKCDPYVFYWKIREFLAGWENMAEAGLPYGVLYEGVDDTDRFSLDNWNSLIKRFRKYAGGSAAQTPLLQAFDVALGIHHYPTGQRTLPQRPGPLPPPANSYLVRMRNYMPGAHRRFLEDLAATCRIREFVQHVASRETAKCGALVSAYNACLGLMKDLRDAHIMIVSRYILAQAKRSHPPKPQASPLTSRIIPLTPPAGEGRADAPGGRLGGDSLPADPIMYPQTNVASGRLARVVDEGSVVRGTGGTDAMQFLKQVRNETARSVVK